MGLRCHLIQGKPYVAIGDSNEYFGIGPSRERWLENKWDGDMTILYNYGLTDNDIFPAENHTSKYFSLEAFLILLFKKVSFASLDGERQFAYLKLLRSVCDMYGKFVTEWKEVSQAKELNLLEAPDMDLVFKPKPTQVYRQNMSFTEEGCRSETNGKNDRIPYDYQDASYVTPTSSAKDDENGLTSDNDWVPVKTKNVISGTIPSNKNGMQIKVEPISPTDTVNTQALPKQTSISEDLIGGKPSPGIVSIDTTSLPKRKSGPVNRIVSDETEEPSSPNKKLRLLVPANLKPKVSQPKKLPINRLPPRRSNSASSAFPVAMWGNQRNKTKEALKTQNVKNAVLSCDVCQQKFTNISKLWDHKLTQMHGEVNCLECSKPLSSKEDMDNHECEKPYRCETCHRSFAQMQGCWMHMRFCNKSYRCSDCGERFQDADSLLTHRITHAGKLTDLTDSLKSLKKKTPTPRKAKPLPGGDCKYCNVHFSPGSKLISHERKCSSKSELIYKCTDCNLRFRTPENLMTHRVTHFS